MQDLPYFEKCENWKITFHFKYKLIQNYGKHYTNKTN